METARVSDGTTGIISERGASRFNQLFLMVLCLQENLKKLGERHVASAYKCVIHVLYIFQ